MYKCTPGSLIIIPSVDTKVYNSFLKFQRDNMYICLNITVLPYILSMEDNFAYPPSVYGKSMIFKIH